jgi:hypothetical protein
MTGTEAGQITASEKATPVRLAQSSISKPSASLLVLIIMTDNRNVDGKIPASQIIITVVFISYIL